MVRDSCRTVDLEIDVANVAQHPLLKSQCRQVGGVRPQRDLVECPAFQVVHHHAGKSSFRGSPEVLDAVHERTLPDVVIASHTRCCSLCREPAVLCLTAIVPLCHAEI